VSGWRGAAEEGGWWLGEGRAEGVGLTRKWETALSKS